MPFRVVSPSQLNCNNKNLDSYKVCDENNICEDCDSKDAAYALCKKRNDEENYKRLIREQDNEERIKADILKKKIAIEDIEENAKMLRIQLENEVALSATTFNMDITAAEMEEKANLLRRQQENEENNTNLTPE